MSLKEKIIKDTAKYNIAQYGSQFLGFFVAVLMRRFLGPYLMGVWSLLKIVIDYASFAMLGVGGAAAYQIPFFKGKGDETAKKEVTDSAFGFIFYTSALAGIIVLCGAIFLRHRYSTEVFIGLVVISAYILLQRVSSYYLDVLRANSRFSIISALVIFDSAINLLLVLILVRAFGIYGLYITVVLLAVFNTLFMHMLARYRIQLAFNLKRILSLIKLGIPLLLLSVLSTILSSVDRIMIAKMLGITFVGYYSIAMMAKGYLIGVTNNFSIVTMPKLMESYGREASIEQIQKFVTISSETISYLFPTLLGCVFLAMPLLVTKVLPQFIPGIIAAQILLLEIFFRSCSPQAEQFLVALGKQTKIIPINIAAILLNVVLNYIFIKRGFSIYGVALGTSIASMLNFLLILVYAMKHFASFKEILIFMVKILAPLVYIGIVLLCCSYFISIKNPYIQLMVNLFILLLMSIPLFVYIDRKTHILRILLGLLGKAGARWRN